MNESKNAWIGIWQYRAGKEHDVRSINYILATIDPHLLDIKPIPKRSLLEGSLINYISTEALAKDIWTIFDLFCKITNQCTGRVRFIWSRNNAS